MTAPRRSGAVRVGVVGPSDAVQRIVDVGQAMIGRDVPAISVVAASYSKQSQIADRVRGMVDRVDALLFAGPLPHDIALAEGVLTRPATHVELTGSSLYGAMIRAMREGVIDVERVSIDSLGADAVAEAYQECQLSQRQVHAMPYDAVDSAAGFAAFHERLYTAGRTTGALTTVGDVTDHLMSRGVPVVRIRATRSALRTSLRAAAFLGAGSLLESAGVAVGVVEVPDLPKGSSGESRQPWRLQQLRLEIVTALRPEAERAGISVLPRDDRSIMLLATVASLGRLTHQFSRADFVGLIQQRTGVAPLVGFGIGETAAAAERRAEQAVSESHGSTRAVVKFGDGSTLSLADEGEDAGPKLVEAKHLDTFHALRGGLPAAGAGVTIVDAESAAQVLGVSPRTARRVLQDLARVGLAWPVPPPADVVTPGRPRQTYRLVDAV
ncbi:helix-turn-helix domain-containing protein [Jiangella rhizosphaerae]|uniref:Transcriptional regulator n=1 Tax=Jiangella rhizosphaerae TaxID=2293569 RepID=A0A418KM35_9ACTN|nr:transcriptional regulator [Jiangella rhizosphaerae]RIQ18995.1 transcriptional regulator [Jiangella rhizosphaerae]